MFRFSIQTVDVYVVKHKTQIRVNVRIVQWDERKVTIVGRWLLVKVWLYTRIKILHTCLKTCNSGPFVFINLKRFAKVQNIIVGHVFIRLDYSKLVFSYSTICFCHRSSKSSSTWKIAGGATLVCSGSLIATALAYSYNTEFRNFVHNNLPGIEPFLGSLDHFLGNGNKLPVDKKSIIVQEDAKNLPSASGPLNLGLTVPKGTKKVRLWQLSN